LKVNGFAQAVICIAYANVLLHFAKKQVWHIRCSDIYWIDLCILHFLKSEAKIELDRYISSTHNRADSIGTIGNRWKSV